eukprot:TRINITY_DN125843_c0_g1_i1.p1 TRINITY_DN125843_c0_g1~~TRINITY_DN125843_c0_g1_i1.p1  ORF type:complete len:435 (+),score=34.10 TRINITY_DN125843_c0_g1_i1:63-1307(+)
MAPPVSWSELGGEELEASLEHVQLIKLHALIELAETQGRQRSNQEDITVMPRCQDWKVDAVAGSAEIKGFHGFETEECSGISHGLNIIVLSICWLDRGHPDILGEQLQFLVPIFKAFEAKAPRQFVVMWDYISLPQRPRTGEDDRSPEQLERFSAALKTINVWYSHMNTYKLLVKRLPEMLAPYKNTKPYDSRGWTTTEQRLSGLVTRGPLLLDLSLPFEAGASMEKISKQCSASRKPPMRPDVFESKLRAGVADGVVSFTAAADIKTVCEQYDLAFKHKLATTHYLSYCGLYWRDPEMSCLCEALLYGLSCEPPLLSRVEELLLLGNDVGDEGAASLARVLDAGCMPALRRCDLRARAPHCPAMTAEGQKVLVDACTRRGVQVDLPPPVSQASERAAQPASSAPSKVHVCVVA